MNGTINASQSHPGYNGAAPHTAAADGGGNAPPYFATFAKMDPTRTDPATGKPGVPEPSNPLYADGLANIGTDTGVLTENADNIAAALKAAVLSGELPQVSYVVSNQFLSEHPVTAPGNGAYFPARRPGGLGRADPDVFDSTLVIVNYDENDGQFDHVPPPVPAPGRPTSSSAAPTRPSTAGPRRPRSASASGFRSS